MPIKLIKTATPPPKEEETQENIDFNNPSIMVFITCCATLVDMHHAIRLLQIDSKYVSPFENPHATREQSQLKQRVMNVGIVNLQRSFLQKLASLEQHTAFPLWKKIYEKYVEDMKRQYEVKT